MKHVGKLSLLELFHAEKDDDLEQELHKLAATQKNACYVLCSNGFFIFRPAKNNLYWSFAKAKKIPSSQEASELVWLGNFPKVPWEEMKRAISFFKAVYNKHQSEAALILYWHPEMNQFKWSCPKQEVSGASVNYDDEHQGEVWIPFLHTHSHAAMSPFHSGTDDKDEKFIDGYNITVGFLNRSVPEFECRIMFGGVDIKRELNDVVEGIPDTEFPKEWLDQVSKKAVATVQRVGMTAGVKNGTTVQNGTKGYQGSQLNGSIKSSIPDGNQANSQVSKTPSSALDSKGSTKNISKDPKAPKEHSSSQTPKIFQTTIPQIGNGKNGKTSQEIMESTQKDSRSSDNEFDGIFLTEVAGGQL